MTADRIDSRAYNRAVASLMNPPNAAEVARELARYVERQAGDLDGDHVEDIMARICTSRSETAEDALASLAWAEGFIAEALGIMQAEAPAQASSAAHLLRISYTLARQAVAALENVTGLEAKSFHGDPSMRN